MLAKHQSPNRVIGCPHSKNEEEKLKCLCQTQISDLESREKGRQKREKDVRKSGERQESKRKREEEKERMRKQEKEGERH